MKKNVFVFPCGSEIGLEIHKSLNASTHFKLIGGSSVDDHGQYVYENYVGGMPQLNDSDFIAKLNEVIAAHDIQFIFPAHDSVVLLLAQAKAAGTLRCDVVTSPLETCEVARSKRRTYEIFDGVIATPRVYVDIDAIPNDAFPVFLKPDVGQGSKGTYTAQNREDASFYLAHDPTLLILEYLPEKEYTVDCFTDRTGTLRFSEGRERIRISNGISVSSETVQDDRFQSLAQKINQTLQFRGMWFFQVKENSAGDFVLMEIAPRVAGTMGLVRCKGVNLPLLSLFDASGFDVDIFENGYVMRIDRALQNAYRHDIQYRHVYLDFDDLVVFEGKVSPLVMAFVFQCRNNGIVVHLITRHAADLDATLKRYHLSELFDEVVWIQDKTPKAAHIHEQDAIFIDDSFAERRAVFDQCNIPVFDSHMLEGLLEK